MKKALVTGGAGFIGQALADHLLASSDYSDVVVLDDLITNPEGIPRGCRFIHGDIRVADDVVRVRPWGPFDEVFHCAASFANELSVNYPRIDLTSNILGTLNVLTELKDMTGLFVYAGSSSSYGNSRGEAFSEDDPLHPGTPYAISKHAGEQYVEVIAENYVIFRFFNVFGPGDTPGQWRNAIPNMLCRARLTGSFVTFGEEKGAGRDFTYISDVVRAMAASHAVPERTVYNLCSGAPSTIKDIAGQVQQWTGAEIVRKDIREWDSVVTRWGDNTRIREALCAADIDENFHTFEGDCVTATFEWLDEYITNHEEGLRRWLQ